jgi:hypothetical protein
VVAASGCRPEPPRPPAAAFEKPDRAWSIERDDDGCWADEHDDCDDSEHTCNPPEPTQVRCVFRAHAHVVQIDDACWEVAPVRHVPCPDTVEVSAPAAPEHPHWLDEGPI